jgi:hypothetical protein
MDWLREPPEPLSRAQLSLETVEGFTLVETFRWNERVKKWTIRFQASLPELDANNPLRTTDWHLTVDETYPLGRIDIYPAKDHGITGTYPHQCYNDDGDSNLPWRAGNICANTQAKVIGRHGYDVEPYTTEDRLLWHCQRAIEWIRCASRGELVLPGEPFELPHRHLPRESSRIIRFSEGAIAASPWSDTPVTSGRARVFNLWTNEKTWFVELLMGPKNEELVQIPWGQDITRHRGKSWDGAWVRLKAMPTVKPYRFPETWGEIKQALSEQNMSLRSILGSVTRSLRDGETHFILIGFPIPEFLEGPPAITHWIALALPVLSSGKAYPNGFRSNEQGHFENDMRTRFCGDEKLEHILTENWHPDQIQNRGRFQEGLRSARVAVIGCGALGAPIAEMLIRGGVHQMTLFDDESIEIGNLTRHTLSMNDIGYGKAARLAQHINSLNPHAEAAPVPSKVSFANEDASQLLLEHDIIIDCTANDELLSVLAGISFPNDVHFFSISIGFRAKRMFCFHAKDESFPVDEYISEMSEWIEVEQVEFKGETFPREGIGCYHPVFPARCDDMWLWASIAVKAIAKGVYLSPTDPELYVYEQNEDEDGSVSIHRAIEVPAYE